MPIYEFNCKPCRDRFEVMISASRIGEARCPRCGSGKITRIFSPFYASTGSSGSSSSEHNCSGCRSHNCSSCR